MIDKDRKLIIYKRKKNNSVINKVRKCINYHLLNSDGAEDNVSTGPEQQNIFI